MGTSGDPNDETRYFTQRDRLWQQALDAEREADEMRRRWNVRILSVTIILISGAVLGVMIWNRW